MYMISRYIISRTHR